MTDQYFLMQDERITAAIAEMQQLISTAFPNASYTTTHQDDPEGIQLIVMVDIEDTDRVVDCFIDRLLTLQVNERIPLYAVPVRSPDRVALQPKPPVILFVGTS